MLESRYKRVKYGGQFALTEALWADLWIVDE